MADPYVHFLAYREYDAARTSANNAIMALLAGSQLASNTLQLTAGSERLLPEIFPLVRHINRFNLRTSLAQELLDGAEMHLAAMAVPYAMAVHEDFIRSCLSLLGDDPDASARTMHSKLALTSAPSDWDGLVETFHIARILRNCSIHAGSRWTDQAAKEFQTDVSEIGVGVWMEHEAIDPRTIKVADKIRLGHSELVATLAITKRLARAVNIGLQHTLDRGTWLELLLDDLRQTEPRHLSHKRRVRKCAGYARFRYQPLGITDDEIRQMLNIAGNETRIQ